MRTRLPFLLPFLLVGTLFPAEVHEVVKAGHLAGLRAQLEKDPGLVNARDENGRSPLHWAARGTRGDLLAYLAGKGADLDALDHNGSSALHSLAERGNVEGIRILLDLGARVDIRDPNLHTPLHLAALGRQVEAIRLLVSRQADLETRDSQGRTPLVVAAREMAGPEVIRTLLDLGSRVEAADHSGDTALSLAAWRGSADVVNLLLQRKAPLPTNPAQVSQVLNAAVARGLTDLFTRLVDQGAEVDAEGAHGRTLLHAAAEGGAVGILEVLRERGLDLNRPDTFGWAPLHFAADMGRMAAAEWLIAQGANPQARTRSGHTALNLAEDNGDKEMLAFLTARGVDAGPARFPELKGEYLGQKRPGRRAEIFAPGIVAGRYGFHSTPVFSPDGSEVFWALSIPPRGTGYASGRTLTSRLVQGRWTNPRVATFGEERVADVPFFHPAGTHLFDMSFRPPVGDPNSRKERIWMWQRRAGGWAHPRPLDAIVNDLPHHWQFSLDRQGNLYFSTNIPGSRGGNDLYVARMQDGRPQAPVNLGPTVNTPGAEDFPFIAPDGRYLLFGRGRDIYVSFRQKDGSWGQARPLGPEVNTSAVEMLPIVSPDGKYLFFTRDRQPYWIDAGVIDAAR